MAGPDPRLRLHALLRSCVKRGEFRLASGRLSDFYFDGKSVSLTGEGAFLAGGLILEAIVEERADAIGGMTLGADPIVGAVLALSGAAGRPLSGFIVRKEPKGHGTGKWIEGPPLQPGARVVVVEDVVTSGGSALQAALRIREEFPQAQVVRVVSLVDREEGGREALEAKGLRLTALFRKSELL